MTISFVRSPIGVKSENNTELANLGNNISANVSYSRPVDSVLRFFLVHVLFGFSRLSSSPFPPRLNLLEGFI